MACCLVFRDVHRGGWWLVVLYLEMCTEAGGGLLSCI